MIYDKIKASIDALGLPFNYGTPTELDSQLNSSEFPAVFMARLTQTQRVNVGSLICEQSNVTLYFVNASNYGETSTEAEELNVAEMTELAEAWVSSVKNQSVLKITNLRYDRVYIAGTRIYTGMGLTATMREVYGSCSLTPPEEEIFASMVKYINTVSGLEATNVQAAIDELVLKIGEPLFLAWLQENATYLTALLDENPNDPNKFLNSLRQWVDLSVLFDEKQDKNLPFENVVVSNFVASTAYAGYPYEAQIPLAGVLSTHFAQLVYGLKNAISNNFAPICETYNGGVKIYAKTNTTITIKTIIILK